MTDRFFTRRFGTLWHGCTYPGLVVEVMVVVVLMDGSTLRRHRTRPLLQTTFSLDPLPSSGIRLACVCWNDGVLSSSLSPIGTFFVDEREVGRVLFPGTLSVAASG
ncbi:hypothetical protein J6590_066810 [Homalodisca vitripennis]|nr:hypothetical protein J6590_066810 [Homalodisca vitripennis]